MPIVVWVGPAGAWAASAGTFITLSADVAAMAEGTSIGDAHPVGINDGSTGNGEPSPQAEKTVNFLAQWAREIADVYYAPTQGILTGGGVIALVIGSVTLFNFQGLEQVAFSLDAWVIALTLGLISSLFGVIVIKGVFSQRQQPALGARQLVGSTGHVTRPPAAERDGLATVEDEYWRIRSPESLSEGDEIRVTDAASGRLVVRRVDP